MSRHLIIISIVVLLAFAGCVGSPQQPTESTTEPTTELTTEASTAMTTTNSGGKLYVALVDVAPEDATVVDLNDSAASENQRVRAALDEALRENGTAITYEPSAYQEIRSSLDELPFYDGDGEFGYYIKYRGQVFRVRPLTNV